MKTEVLLIPAALLLLVVLTALIVVVLRVLARWLLDEGDDRAPGPRR